MDKFCTHCGAPNPAWYAACGTCLAGLPAEKEKTMWEGRCVADTLEGERCSKRSLEAYWVHSFQGEKFNGATWVEVCETHVIHAMLGGMVASLDIRHHTKG